MAATVSTSYPTTPNNLDIVANVTSLDTTHWEEGVIERQHFVYKYRRCIILNMCLDRVTGSSTTQSGMKTSATAYNNGGDDLHFYHVPVTSNLFTIDDFDADVIWGVRVKANCTAVVAGTGKVLVRLDDGSGATDVEVAVNNTTNQWFEDLSTGALAKNTTNIQLAINMKVDNGQDTIELTHIMVYTLAQGSIE